MRSAAAAFSRGVRPTENETADRLEPRRVGDRSLQRRRPRAAANAFDGHAVGAVFAQPDAGEIRAAIRRQVGPGVAQFVEQLFLDDGRRHPPAGSGMFGHDETAVGTRLDDGKADIRHIGYRLPVERAVPAGALRAALDDVSGDGSGGQAVPIVRQPAELMDQRRQRQRRVGRSAGNDDVRAGLQRLDERERSEIDVRAQDALADGLDARAAVEIVEAHSARPHRVEPLENVVSRHDGDLRAADTGFFGGGGDGLRAAAGVHAAGVRHHLDIALDELRQQADGRRHDVPGVARGRDCAPSASAESTS